MLSLHDARPSARDHTSTLRANAMRELTSAQRPTVARSVIGTMTAYVTKASSALMKVSDSTIPVRDRMLARSALIDMLLPVTPDEAYLCARCARDRKSNV